MTTEAGALHLTMVDTRGRDPQARSVARLAGTAGLDVRTVLAGGRAAVVAGDTVTGHTGMIECSPRPG